MCLNIRLVPNLSHTQTLRDSQICTNKYSRVGTIHSGHIKAFTLTYVVAIRISRRVLFANLPMQSPSSHATWWYKRRDRCFWCSDKPKRSSVSSSSRHHIDETCLAGVRRETVGEAWILQSSCHYVKARVASLLLSKDKIDRLDVLRSRSSR